MKSSKVEVIRELSSNLLAYLLSIPIEERTEMQENLDNLEILLSILIDNLDNIEIDNTVGLKIELDLSYVDWCKYQQ